MAACRENTSKWIQKTKEGKFTIRVETDKVMKVRASPVWIG